MGQAKLQFPSGPGISFRINPNQINWNFTINTQVQDTVGGRVVQVVGATLSDIVIAGQLGEKRSGKPVPGEDEHDGASWRLHQRFQKRIRRLMEYQSEDSTKHRKIMHEPARFTFPQLNMNYEVYIKSLQDPDGGTVQFRTAKFSHTYILTLFVVRSGSDTITSVGSLGDSYYDKAKTNAIAAYIERISDGVGWRPTEYNGLLGDYFSDSFGVNSQGEPIDAGGEGHGDGDDKDKGGGRPENPNVYENNIVL